MSDDAGPLPPIYRMELELALRDLEATTDEVLIAVKGDLTREELDRLDHVMNVAMLRAASCERELERRVRDWPRAAAFDVRGNGSAG